jgi:hypothetical protein
MVRQAYLTAYRHIENGNRIYYKMQKISLLKTKEWKCWTLQLSLYIFCRKILFESVNFFSFLSSFGINFIFSNIYGRRREEQQRTIIFGKVQLGEWEGKWLRNGSGPFLQQILYRLHIGSKMLGWLFLSFKSKITLLWNVYTVMYQ